MHLPSNWLRLDQATFDARQVVAIEERTEAAEFSADDVPDTEPLPVHVTYVYLRNGPTIVLHPPFTRAAVEALVAQALSADANDAPRSAEDRQRMHLVPGDVAEDE